MNDIFREVLTRNFGCTITKVSLDDVYYSIGQLKCDKAAGVDGLSAECINFAHSNVVLILCTLFYLCLKHSFVLANFCSGRIVPVHKKSSECSTFDDFRPVTSINVLVKIFEYCLLSKVENYFVTHDLQFGFTVGGGCGNAIFILRSVVEYFAEHGNSIYMSVLDILKAYDRVNHCLLLLKLIEADVSDDIVLMYAYWFRHLVDMAVSEGVSSEQFNILSGVH